MVTVAQHCAFKDAISGFFAADAISGGSAGLVPSATKVKTGPPSGVCLQFREEKTRPATPAV